MQSHTVGLISKLCCGCCLLRLFCCRNSSSTEMLFFLLQLFFHRDTLTQSQFTRFFLTCSNNCDNSPLGCSSSGRTGILLHSNKKHHTQTTLRRKTKKKLCLLFNQALRLVVSFVCKTAPIRRRPTRLVEVQVVGTDADDDELLLRPNCTKYFAERNDDDALGTS